MAEAISNTSPLLYLYRIGAIEWLERLFVEVWVPEAVAADLSQGLRKGYDAPDPRDYGWIRRVEPRSVPSEWLALDLGPGETATMALALENPERIVLLDDALARRVAQAAGLRVWGTLRVLLEAKSEGLTGSLGPLLDRLRASGMWLSEDARRRVLALAGEDDEAS